MTVNSERNQNEANIARDDPMIILEDALTLCKFGRFHVKLLVASLCTVFATVMVTTTSSFILPIAECDLQMDIMMKGWLNATPFFGQIATSLFIGFLVDTFGRRIFLLSGNIGMFICTILEGSSQTYWMLIFIKLVQGVVMSLSFTAINTMVSEFVSKEIRDRVLLLQGSFMSMSLIVVALVSWAILPQQIQIVVWEGYFELHSWNIYIYVCSVWSFLAAILYYKIPESPKFLLSQGRNKEAIEVLRKIYSENTGNDKDTFPIKSINCVVPPKNKATIIRQIVNSMFEVKHLLVGKLVSRLVLLSIMTFVCLSTNSNEFKIKQIKPADSDKETNERYTCLRLWYPQLSTIVENYYKDKGSYSEFCEMIDHKPNISSAFVLGNDNCEPIISGSTTYINSIILGVISLLCVGVSGFLVDLMGYKLLLFTVLLSCTACSGALYFTMSSIQIAILISATCALMQTNASLQMSIIMRVFPTQLRALAFAIVIIVGRIGSLLGNILFPVLLKAGCMAPFLTLSGASLCLSGLVFYLPDPNKENKDVGDN